MEERKRKKGEREKRRKGENSNGKVKKAESRKQKG